MKSRLAAVAVVLSLGGLAASIASLVDDFGPTFCSDSGCDAVRASAWAHPLGIPMGAFGVAYFAAMVVLSFWSRPRLRIALAIAGGAWGVTLVALQAFVIGAWCKLCLVADPIAVALAITVALGTPTMRPSRLRVLALAPALGALLLALRLFAHASTPAIPAGTPDVVAREQLAGQVTVVEFVDFECPFCRRMQPTLAAAMAGRSVHVVRKMVPLPQHEHALPAALAWCCANAQGKGDAMAAALFAAEPASLTPTGCEQIAARVGCDLDRYRRDFPATIGLVAADMLDARGAGIRSLPTIFVGNERITGANYSVGELTAMLDRAR